MSQKSSFNIGTKVTKNEKDLLQLYVQYVRTVTKTRLWYAAWSCAAPESPGSYECSWANCHKMRNE